MKTLFAPALLLPMLLCGCPQAVGPVVATLETAICVLNTYSTDKANGETDQQAIADTIAKCATDAATVATVLDASKAANARLKASGQ